MIPKQNGSTENRFYMNDFTKDELQQIMWAIHDEEFPLPISLGNKIQSMIDNKKLSEDNVIHLKETTPEFRKGFIAAMRCILDMGKGNHTYESLLRVVDSMIKLNDQGSFFPENMK